MKKVLFFIMVISFTKTVSAQINDKELIKRSIITLFDGMRKADTVMMRSVIEKDMVLQSVTNKNGTTELITEPLSTFLRSVAKLHDKVYDERVVFADIKSDGDLASVWAPYKFYYGSQLSHCGVDVFQLMKSGGMWKIIYIVDTRRKDNCPE